MRQTVRDYQTIVQLSHLAQMPRGDSASPRELIFHIFPDNSKEVSVLDIGFGEGILGKIIKSNPATAHWHVDGLDGWEPNCLNSDLFRKGYYRNVWHGLAQSVSSDQLAGYQVICLLDVVEHLTADCAKWLLRTLLSSLGKDSYLFVSTPLWFYPQANIQDGDLEEHLIGVPASSMLALLPVVYAINNPLVGGFVYGKRSLEYVEFFHPHPYKNFSYEMGLNILRALNVTPKPGILYRGGV